jgi:hypothetical protein
MLGIVLPDEFENLDDLALDACRIIGVEIQTGTRFNVRSGQYEAKG